MLVGITGFNSNSTITESFNNAKVDTSGYIIGGIVGGNDTSAYITNCYNRGVVTGTGKDSYEHGCVGGIVGANAGTSTIKNCYNTGNVTASYPYVGGIVGYNGNDSSGTQTVYNVWNSATIKKSSTSASSNIGTSSNYVGYLIGRYQSLTGKYGNTTKATMSAWTQSTINSNLSGQYTADIKKEDGTWKYNDGYPILKWQLEE